MTETSQIKSTSKGKPIQIVSAIIENGRSIFHLDMENLESLLLHPNVRTNKVVVVSVAGAFRQGKSFLLDFFLRFLHAEGMENWIGEPDLPLEGFVWRGGSERETTGIYMWSEPFMRTLPSSEKVAVLLMDTQGAFDSRSTVRESATVFALSTLLSSIQVFNLNGNIQEDHLQHLQLFTEYGRLAMEKGSSVPFQHLHFLVRDWSYPYEYPYGAVGGKALITKRLKTDPSQPKELQMIRTHLCSCFQQIQCFLMPHPGMEVATNPNFKGCIADMQPEFVECLQQIVPNLLSPLNLVVKEINGQQLLGRDLLQYFISYTKIYQTDEIPEPKSVLEATAEANNLTASAHAIDFYTKKMEKVCGTNKSFISHKKLESFHKRYYDNTLTQFQNYPKMGGKQFSQKFEQDLIVKLNSLFEQYEKNNSHKNVLSSFQTPLFFLAAAFWDYFIWSISSLFGLLVIENCCQLMFIVFITVIFMWIYVQITGNFSSIGVALDKTTELLIQKIVLPLIPFMETRRRVESESESSSSMSTTRAKSE